MIIEIHSIHLEIIWVKLFLEKRLQLIIQVLAVHLLVHSVPLCPFMKQDGKVNKLKIFTKI
jgi:hypothetical protein